MAAISIFTITNAVLTANVITYTGSITSGATPLITGTPVIVAGCTTAAFNGNFVITGGNLTTTFTVALTHANIGSEVESGATGRFDLESIAVYPTDICSNTFGYGIFARFLMPTSVPLGNGQTGGNVSGIGQIYPTGQQ